MSVQTSLRPSGVSHRQTDGQTERISQSCHQAWQTLASQRSVSLDGADRTEALRNSLCTAASIYGGYRCQAMCTYCGQIMDVTTIPIPSIH